jgi:hypothetical protein
VQIAFYEANEEPKITYAGSMHNAEILSSNAPADRNDHETQAEP